MNAQLSFLGVKDERIIWKHEIWEDKVSIYAKRSRRLFNSVQRVDANYAFCQEALKGHGRFYTEGKVLSNNVVAQGN